MPENPKISVCIPTFNRAEYLRDAMESALQQTYSNFELLVVDDASNDSTPEVVASFKDPRIRYFRNAENIGMVRNWNRCLEVAAGEYVTILCDDDLMHPENLSEKMKAFESEGVDLVFCAMNIVDEQGRQVRVYKHYPKSRYLSGPAKIVEWLGNGNGIGCPSLVMVRASVLQKAGRFNETLLLHVDQEMWLRILLMGNAYFLENVLVSVRMHQKSVSSSLEQAGRIRSERIKFLLLCYQNPQIMDLLEPYPDVRQFNAWLLGWFNYQSQNIKEARRWLQQAVRVRPLSVYSLKAIFVLFISIFGRNIAGKVLRLYDFILNPVANRLRRISRRLRAKRTSLNG